MLREGCAGRGLQIKRSFQKQEPSCLLCDQAIPAGQQYIRLMDHPSCAVCYKCGSQNCWKRGEQRGLPLKDCSSIIIYPGMPGRETF